MPKRLEIAAGTRFGRWTVLAEAEPAGTASRRTRRWLAQCDCGSPPRAVAQKDLVGGKSRSCGCLSRERSSAFFRKRNTTDGLSSTPEYQAWADMKRRCLDENQPKWKHWGGGGITVCERWLHGDGQHSGLECFLADMGTRPAGMTVEREDNDGPYSPDNCVWATRRRQERNKRGRSPQRADGSKR
jgi:hypothetical protein